MLFSLVIVLLHARSCSSCSCFLARYCMLAPSSSCSDGSWALRVFIVLPHVVLT